MQYIYQENGKVRVSSVSISTISGWMILILRLYDSKPYIIIRGLENNYNIEIREAEQINIQYISITFLEMEIILKVIDT